MPQLAFTVEATPVQGDLDELYRQLKEYNRPYLGWVEHKSIAVLLKDGEGQLVGGVLGSTSHGWLEIYQLWIREELRGKGHGRTLVRMVEAEAVARGCTQVVLDTFDFQAPGFYEKLGYEVIAHLEYGEHRRYFMKKRLHAQTDSNGHPSVLQ